MRSTILTAGLVAVVLLLIIAPAATVRDGIIAPAATVRDAATDASAAAALPPPEVVAGPARGSNVPSVVDPAAALECRRQRPLVRTGLSDLAAGDLAGASQAFAALLRAPGPRSPLAGHVALRLGRALAAADDLAAAEPWLARAVSDSPASIEAEARVQWARVLMSSGRAAEAVAAVGPLVREGAPEAAETVDALALGAAAARQAGDDGVARRCEHVLFYRYPTNDAARGLARTPPWSDEVAHAIGERRFGDVLSRAELLLAARDVAPAHADAEAVLAANPSPAERDVAEVLLGRALRAAGKTAQACTHFGRVTNADPAVATRAAYLEALAERSLRHAVEFRRLIRKASSGPPSPWRDQAAMALADDEAAAGHWAAAQAAWDQVAREGVAADDRVTAGWKRPWSLYREGPKDQAQAAFDRLASGAPSREVAAARYWAARIAREGGDRAGASARLAQLAAALPNDYYGALAAEESGQALALPDLGVRTDVERTLGDALSAIAARDPDGSLRLRELLAVGLTDDALREVRAIESAATGTGSTAVREAAWQARVLVLGHDGRVNEALRALRAGAPDWRARRDIPPAVWASAYPIAHDALVMEACRQRGLEPALVFGLIHQESAFDAQARSCAGACGLMQVMPSTGRTIARWLDERPHGIDLYDPPRNVRYGTEYLRRLLDRFGSPELALAGYNAGGGRVERWWAQLPKADVPLFVESIPIGETRDYVKAIAWNCRLYRRAFGSGPEGARAVEVAAVGAP